MVQLYTQVLFKYVRVFINRSMSKCKDIGCTISQANAGYTDEKLISPAASRNKDPILQVLKRFIISETDQIEDESPLFLEISSGTGQHISHFASHFPGVRFQPSEVDKSLFKSISLYATSCSTKNILQPIFIDVQNKLSYYGFEEGTVDYMFNANMIHISSFECTIGLFENAGVYLKPEALMLTYGPYSKDGLISPQSNITFHASLRARNPLWGIRDINDLVKLGDENNLTLIDTIEMPANNLTLIWKKD